MNILKRAMGYMLIVGAGLTQPRIQYDEAAKAEKLRIQQVFSVGVLISIEGLKKELLFYLSKFIKK